MAGRHMTPFALALVVACGGDKDADTAAALSPDLVMTDANNYVFLGDIEIGAVEIERGSDALVDWCGLTTDIRGRSIDDPSAIERVLLLELELTQEEVMAKVESNTLSQADTNTQWIVSDPGACALNFSEFTILGNVLDPEDVGANDNTWLASVANFPDGRFDILMSSFVAPSDTSTNTNVLITDTSSVLSVEVDLASSAPIVAPAGADAYTLDWSDLNTDAYGSEYDDEKGNRILIGKVNYDTVAEVEDVFLRVDSEADELYYLSTVDGTPVVQGETDADLMLATDADGNAFTGFTTDGIWLLGIECLSCTSPAPLALSVVEVR